MNGALQNPWPTHQQPTLSRGTATMGLTGISSIVLHCSEAALRQQWLSQGMQSLVVSVRGVSVREVSVREVSVRGVSVREAS